MSQRMLLALVAAVIAMITSSTASAARPSHCLSTQLLTGLEGGSGSTVGPGGALYVTESDAGRISRVDPRTGEITTFASGLPPSIIGVGGTTDVAFIGGTAYALVTLVGPDSAAPTRRHLPNRRPRQLHRGRGHRRVRLEQSRRDFRSTSRPESSTRWRPTAASSWSPMGTTTGSTGSPATARSAS